MAKLKRSPTGAAMELFLQADDILVLRGDMRLFITYDHIPYGYEMPVKGREPNGWRIDNNENAVEAILMKERGQPYLSIVDNPSNPGVMLRQPLDFSDIVHDAYDFIQVFRNRPYARPAELAVFTHVYNDKVMLGVFLDFYSRHVPRENLYVINHGSDPEQIDVFRDRAVVVDIPRGAVDHENISHFCGTFQRFLLTQYEYVIHVDSDELLVFEDQQGTLGEHLRRFPKGAILKAKHGYNLVHDASTEAAIDLSRPISLQRDHLVADEYYRKPAIASRPTTWGKGFHTCLEPVLEIDTLWMVHLREFDLGHSVWRESDRTRWPDQDSIATRDENGNPTGRMPNQQLCYDYQQRMLKDPTHITMPAWMKGRF